jgi:hypothetical protein
MHHDVITVTFKGAFMCRLFIGYFTTLFSLIRRASIWTFIPRLYSDQTKYRNLNGRNLEGLTVKSLIKQFSQAPKEQHLRTLLYLGNGPKSLKADRAPSRVITA